MLEVSPKRHARGGDVRYRGGRRYQCLVETERTLKQGAKFAKSFGPCLTRGFQSIY